MGLRDQFAEWIQSNFGKWINIKMPDAQYQVTTYDKAESFYNAGWSDGYQKGYDKGMYDAQVDLYQDYNDRTKGPGE